MAIRFLTALSFCAVTATSAMAQNMVINELMAANVDVYQDPSTNFGSWVELYNTSASDISLGGLYVTTDAANLKQHQLVSSYGTLPAHGFAILNFDHHDQWTSYSFRQIDDKLDADGGTVIISDGTTILAQVTYPAAIARVAYARTTDGGEEWGNTSSPTPGKSNATSSFATKQLDTPVVSPEAQFFSGKMDVTVTIPEGATLRYTTDGTTPTMTNGTTSTTGTFTVSSTTCYRFRLFQDGKLASGVTTRSYIQGTGILTFPVINVVSDPSYIMDGSDKAIFSYSSYGRTGNGQSKSYNGNMDWDRPVHFEFFTTDGKCKLSQECDFSAAGGWTRAYSPHSFKLKANKIYDGVKTLDYQFFGTVDENPSTAKGKDYLKHKVLQIRNGGNDTYCRIKDAAVQEIVASSGLYVEHQAWQPVMVYLNGTFYSVLNMREPNNKHYGYANYGIDTDLMDQFEMSPDSGYVQKEGTKEAFSRWYELSKTASSAESYQEICKLVDIDEYCNYMASCLYIGSWDWPQNNIKAFRDQSDGRFRFVIFDIDDALGTATPLSLFFSKKNYTFDSLYGYDYSTGKNITKTQLTKEIEFVTIFQNMLSNDTFRKKFIDTYCLVTGSVFEPQRVAERVTAMASYLSTGGYVDPSYSAAALKEGFSDSRQAAIINELKSSSYMKLSSTTPQTVALSSNIPGGQILVNGIEVPTGAFSGQLFPPVTLTAKSSAGYHFMGWASTSGEGTPLFSNGSTWKYYDSGSLDNADWKSASYSDTAWKSGATPIGYGKSQPTLTTKNLLTYYFRKTISLNDCSSSDVFTLNYTIDDGMVVYVNGKEAGRYNMPSGTTSYSTAAASFAKGNPDTGTMTLDASLFQKGSNVIAVEVHNNQSTSSDITWDCELLHRSATASYVCNDCEYTIPQSGNYSLVAQWEKIPDADAVDSCAFPVKINEVSAANDIFLNELLKKDDWVELYNTTDMDIDLAGLYLSDDAGNPQKYQIESSVCSTIIPANGYKVVWCSKRTAASQLHAPFKLGNDDGSMILLSSGDEFVLNNSSFYAAHPEMQRSFTDTIRYNAMRYDQTVGRFPDGARDYYLMNRATIAYANSIQGSDSWIGRDAAYTAPLTGIDEISGEKNCHSSISMEKQQSSFYNLNGQRVTPNTKGIIITNGKKVIK